MRHDAVGLLTILLLAGLLGTASVQAQTGPIIVSATGAVAITPPVLIPHVIVGRSAFERHGLMGSTSGRANVDVDIDRSHQHGHAVGGSRSVAHPPCGGMALDSLTTDRRSHHGTP
jgi:hypothetical protein